jgi:hypothetical protein
VGATHLQVLDVVGMLADLSLKALPVIAGLQDDVTPILPQFRWLFA